MSKWTYFSFWIGAGVVTLAPLYVLLYRILVVLERMAGR